MAKEQRQQESASAPESVLETVVPPKSYRLQVALALVSLILFQLILLWLLLPSRTSVQRGLGLNVVNGTGQFEGVQTVTPDVGSKEPMLEKPLNDGNKFTVKSSQGETNETFSVTIYLKIRKADDRRFTRRYDECMFEIQARVVAILTASNDQERNEVNFTTLREKLKRAINGVLRTPWVQEVLFTEYGFESQ